jgi:hypothetical protein
MEEISEMGGEDSPLAINDRKIVGGIFVLLVLFLGAFSDYDEDGLSNISEFTIHDTDMLELDTDWDGLTDKEELDIGTNPMKKDTDEDGLKDGAEFKYIGTDPNMADTDGDSISDSMEISTYRTNPLEKDSDSDGLFDGEEINYLSTNPILADSDNDGLNDGEEINNYLTNPNIADSDSDEISDGDEVSIHGSNPLETDSDNDGINDGIEVLNYGTNPASNDSDGDSLNDKDEIEIHGTNPISSDSDSDNLSDDEEINSLNTDPLDSDSDDDGLLDGYEVNNLGTDPLHVDSDRDGVNDAEDILPLIDVALRFEFGFEIDDDEEAPDSYFYFEITPDGAESGCGAGDGDQSICHYTETYYDTYNKVLDSVDLFYLDWRDDKSEFTLLIRGWEEDSGWLWNTYEDLDLGPSGTEWISVNLLLSDFDDGSITINFESYDPSGSNHDEGIPTKMTIRLTIS